MNTRCWKRTMSSTSWLAFSLSSGVLFSSKNGCARRWCGRREDVSQACRAALLRVLAWGRQSEGR